jgi:WD40 repeat protein
MIGGHPDKICQQSHLWEVQTGRILVSYQIKAPRVLVDLKWSPDGQWLLGGGDDGSLAVWEAHTGKHLASYYRGHERWFAVAWSPNGKYIAGGAQGYVCVLDALSCEKLHAYGDERGWSQSYPFTQALAWSPDSRFLVAGISAKSSVYEKDVEVPVWEALTSKELLTYRGHAGHLSCASWSPDGQYIASSAEDRTVQIWDARQGKTLLKFEEHPVTVSHMAWSADCSWIVSTCRRRILRWDSTTGALLNIYEGGRT